MNPMSEAYGKVAEKLLEFVEERTTDQTGKR